MVSSNIANVSTKINGLSANQFMPQGAQEICNSAVSNHTYRYGQKVLNDDTVQLNQTVENAKEQVKSKLDNVDWKKVRKTAITAVLTVATVLGVTKITNKNVNNIWKIGERVDTAVKNSKLCNTLSNACKKIAEKNPLKKSKLLNDIKDVTKSSNRLQPKMSFAKMSVLGPKGIFSLTASDILTNTAAAVGDKAKFTQYLEALVGKDAKICGKTVAEMAEACFKNANLGDSFKFSQELMQAVKDKHGLKNTQEMLKFFDNLKVGKIGSETFDFAKDIKMRGWIKGSRGNLGETMKKFAIMNGQAAQTKAGKVVQQVPLILGESIGNCINDRSTFGILMTASYLPSVYNQAQDAPKGKKVKTVVSELVSSAASWAVGMAGSGAIIYSLASLKNLKTTGKMANILKAVGSVASMGLHANSKKPAKIAGGALRLGAVISLSGKISKPIDNAIKKVCGLPTEKEKAAMDELKAKQEKALEQAQQIQAMQNTEAPALTSFNSFDLN